MCLAGLWITDGRRRGAILAIGCDVVHAILLVLSAQWGIELALAVVLSVATIWVMPSVER